MTTNLLDQLIDLSASVDGSTLTTISETFANSVEIVTKAGTGENPNKHWVQMGAFIGAGLAMIGACGVGAGQGYAAGAVALAVSRNPEAKPTIMSSMIVGMAIAESAAIYSLIIAILLIFVAPTM